MKKRIVLLIIGIFIIGLLVTTYKIGIVGADSGFDASYDSSSSSSDSDGGSIFYLIYLCIEYPPLGLLVLGIIIAVIFSSNKNKNEITNKALTSKLELLDINKYDINKQLEIEAFNIYKTIQFAWMNFDTDTIRKYTTDEMYNMYLMQLETLKVKNQKNLMYDIRYIDSKIVNKYEENNQETYVINMVVSCHDFIIDTNTKKTVRGNPSYKYRYTYELTFVKTVDNKELDICPRCGAPVDLNNSGVCEYCNSTLISNNYTLVMSKKEMKYQKRT